MTALYILGGVGGYLVVGTLVVGLGRRRLVRTPHTSIMLDDDYLSLGCLTLIWPIVVACFAIGGVALCLGHMANTISTFGRKEKK